MKGDKTWREIAAEKKGSLTMTKEYWDSERTGVMGKYGKLDVGKKRTHILDLSYTELKEWLKSIGEPASRADQIFKWAYRKSAVTFEDMIDLPSATRLKLDEQAVLTTLQPLKESISGDGQTRKVLFQLEDGKTIESTLMFYRKPGASRERRTVCVSSQVGCPIGCHFCATGQQGFERNLRPGEIIEQVLFFQRICGLPITNVVFMGMGEPLANYDSVLQAIANLNSPQGLGLGFRQITLSTSGLSPQIRELAKAGLQFELAISLHAATDVLRNRLVPINKKYPLDDLIAACRDYSVATGRLPFFEYALFKGINDSARDAEDLVGLLEDFKGSINLIVGNPTSDQQFCASSLKSALKFQKRLMDAGFRCMIRVSKGVDIDAGCGQLKSRWVETRPKS